MSVNFIPEFGLLFLTVVVISYIIKLLRQPIIIGYVLSGIVSAYYLTVRGGTGDQIIVLSELGITFLLFLMGLEFDLSSLRYLGKDMVISTLLQSAAFFGGGYLLAFLFGFSSIEGVYLGILFMFSSTLLVAKWLEDKKDTTTLYGKITLSTLVLQDILAIIALTLVGVANAEGFTNILLIPLKGILLLFLAFVLARSVLNSLLRRAGPYPELLFISSLGICFLFVVIAPFFGYSATIGAFIGGVTLANTLYKQEILGRLKPLIIFFNMLFFVGLGFQASAPITLTSLLFVILIIVACLVVKPLIFYLTIRQRGYDLKTSFLSSLHLTQFSEFAIIIIAQGISVAGLSQEISIIAIIAVIVSMILSSYVIKYAEKIYKVSEKKLWMLDKLFKRRRSVTEHLPAKGSNILFFGYYDLGKELYDKLRQLGKTMLVVEQDPVIIETLKREGIPYVYTSPSNPEFLEHFPLDKVELMISNLTSSEENKSLIKEMKRRNPNAITIVTAKSLRDSLDLYEHQADYVIYQSLLNEQQVSVLLEDYTSDINRLIHRKLQEMEEFKKRQEHHKKSLQQNKFVDIDNFLHIVSKTATITDTFTNAVTKTIKKTIPKRRKPLSKLPEDKASEKSTLSLEKFPLQKDSLTPKDSFTSPIPSTEKPKR